MSSVKRFVRLTGSLLLAVCWLPLAPAAPEEPPPQVAACFFYWYRWPDEHFNQPGAPGREGHCRHLVDPEQVSYESADWFAREFRDMAAAGIDVALPVYWGAPGAYERPGIRFSRAGLGPLVLALDRLEENGEAAPKVGLFYDTTTLLNDVRGAEPAGGRADLTTPAGRRLFVDTITDYFAAIPKRHWARLARPPLEGAVPVALYASAFAARWDAALGDELRRAFAARFPGERPCLVADQSWGEIGQDLTTGWGAALGGPVLLPSVAQIGPGYDDSAVPARHTPIREREDGAFYRWSWRKAIEHRPAFVIIETWNEMHEGTEICRTIEEGDLYLRITREYVDRLKSGAGPGPEVVLAHAAPRCRPDLSWGEEGKGAAALLRDFRSGRKVGLRERSWEDGPIREEGGFLCSVPAEGTRYVYFQASDYWRFDAAEDLQLCVTRRPGAGVWLEYDSRDPAGVFEGSYTVARAASSEERDGVLTEVYGLPGARLANRQNGGADFRFVVATGGALDLVSVELRPAR